MTEGSERTPRETRTVPRGPVAAAPLGRDRVSGGAGGARAIRILFVIRSLGLGGAERQFVELIKGLDPARFAVTVATLYDGGALRAEIERLADVRLVSLAKRGRWDVLAVGRFWRLARSLRPEIVHGFMGVANELAALVGKGVRGKIVWGLRASVMDFSQYDWVSRAAFRAGAWFSRSADLIIVNSRAGLGHFSAHGYAEHHMTVIPNGVDTVRFGPRREERERWRAAWHAGPEDEVVGLIARLDPMKDHPTFLRAAALLAGRRPRSRFVCVGDGPPGYTASLRALVEELGIGDRVAWPGAAADPAPIYSALDIATSASKGEGLSNVVLEAMACEAPCVVTDVGDSAWALGNCGVVVSPGEPRALAEGWERVLAMSPAERRALGTAARQRVVEMFSLDAMCERTAAALEHLVLSSR